MSENEEFEKFKKYYRQQVQPLFDERNKAGTSNKNKKQILLLTAESKLPLNDNEDFNYIFSRFCTLAYLYLDNADNLKEKRREKIQEEITDLGRTILKAKRKPGAYVSALNDLEERMAPLFTNAHRVSEDSGWGAMCKTILEDA